MTGLNEAGKMVESTGELNADAEFPERAPWPIMSGNPFTHSPNSLALTLGYLAFPNIDVEGNKQNTLLAKNSATGRVMPDIIRMTMGEILSAFFES